MQNAVGETILSRSGHCGAIKA